MGEMISRFKDPGSFHLRNVGSQPGRNLVKTEPPINHGSHPRRTGNEREPPTQYLLIVR
jgi:hypothetical protein